MTGTSSAAHSRPESPRPVEGGGESGANTSLSSGPKGAFRRAGRLRRARPIQRRGHPGPHKAAPREGAANQRWYRDALALCPQRPPERRERTGGVFLQRQGLLTERQRGTLFVFLAAVLYSIGGLCIKVIPWNGLSINSARNIVALLVVGGYLVLSRHRLRLNRWIALGALSVCGTNVLFSVANKLTTAANTIVLQFTAPIFVILLTALFWRKKPERLDLIACALVLAGVVCFFVDSLEMGGMLGNVLALASGLSYAGVFLLNDLPDADPISSVFWGDAASVVIGFPFLLGETDFSPTAIVSVVILGAFQVGLAYVLMCIGLRTTPAVTASLISGIEPVLNPVLVAVFYGEKIGRLALVGAVIVVASVVGYNVIRGRRESEEKTEKV